MKTTLSLLALFVLVLGGGYAWSQYQTQQTAEMLPASPSESGYDDSDMREEDNSGKGSDDDDQVAPAAATGSYTLAQVAIHSSAADCWTAINGSVYNLSAWIARHPGGAVTNSRPVRQGWY